MIVSSGSMTQVAITRGVTSFCTGSVPSARMASICSVTFMEPSSLAIPEAFRPATSSDDEHRAEFADERDRDDLSRLSSCAVCGERARHLQRHDRAAEKAGQNDNRQAADADDVHLHENVAAIMRAAKYVSKSASAEEDEILEGGYWRFQEIQQMVSGPLVL